MEIDNNYNEKQLNVDKNLNPDNSEDKNETKKTSYIFYVGRAF